MCEFHGSNSNGFGDIWWTDNPIYFSSIDIIHSDNEFHISITLWLKNRLLHNLLHCDGTMKHEVMPDNASFDVKLPKSIYSDNVILRPFKLCNVLHFEGTMGK